MNLIKINLNLLFTLVVNHLCNVGMLFSFSFLSDPLCIVSHLILTPIWKVGYYDFHFINVSFKLRKVKLLA